ncbi:MAG: polysaccharide deacetylase family protein [Clostridia bacterium]|nr:polysaccharide deacetylase family protein [Clostridia bacterium]MBP3292423.1 polysaccharide deacetylase family protein [Clostridia bacterium]
MRRNRILKSVLCAGIVLMFGGTVVFPVSSAEVVYSWHTNDKTIALTFDDGPHPVYTPEILDILGEYGVKATFFTIGQNVEWYNDVFRMEYAAGHEIGNHTYSHQNLRKLPYKSVCREIEQAEELVYEATEYRTRLLRPPEGAFGHDLCKAAAELDYTVICWSVDTLDWAHTPSDEIVTNVLENVKGGDIILFHDYIAGDSPTPDALRVIIPALLDEGYRFVTVSELLNGK